jgi:hypothetical protein
MSRVDHRGFDWKEIAEVLHISGVSARVIFWREVQCLRSETADRQPRATIHQQESDSVRVKLDKGIRGSRQTR